MKQIGPRELQRSDGREGRPSFVAVEGKVYDVSDSALWAGGRHMNAHQAGHDLTRELQAAPHGPEVLQRVKLVGEYAEQPEAEPARPAHIPPAKLARLLALHPHAISAHFPIALSLSAALFTLLGWILGNEWLQAAGWYNLLLVTLAAPVAIAAGILSWWYNHSGTWTPVFRKKATLSVVLVALVAAAVVIRLGLIDPGEGASPWLHAHRILVLLLVPVVIRLGYLGGTITFPR